MNINRWDRKRIEQALYSAIDNERAFIDAHKTELKMTKNGVVNVVPKEFRPIVNTTHRTIAAWKRILKKMQSGEI